MWGAGAEGAGPVRREELVPRREGFRGSELLALKATIAESPHLGVFWPTVDMCEIAFPLSHWLPGCSEPMTSQLPAAVQGRAMGV